MFKFVMDDMAAAADIVAVEAIGMMNSLFGEAETVADYVIETVSRMESILLRATGLMAEL